MANVGLRDLLEAGVHFGHQTRKWNPKMKPYIFIARGGIYIIDLQRTLRALNQARDFLPEEVLESDPQVDRNLPKVAIISQALAKALWPDDASVIGKTLFLGTGGADGNSVQVVGVVERMQTPWAAVGPSGEYSLILPLRYLDPFTRYSVRTEPGRQAQVMAFADIFLILAIIFAAMIFLVPLVQKPRGPAGAPAH